MRYHGDWGWPNKAIWLLGTVGLALAPAHQSTIRAASTVRFDVTGADGRALPCRIHLAGADGKPQQAEGLPFFCDHFVCPGTAELALPAGRYRYQVERGPEHMRLWGKFTLDHGERKSLTLRLDRIADLAAAGWFAGDLHVHRPVADLKLLMQAEDLHVAPVITWWNDRNQWTDKPVPAEPVVSFEGDRFYHVLAGEDERAGGALMYFNLRRPLAITGSSPEYPSPMEFAAQARQDPAAWIDIEKPFWWDVPVWLASGLMDSIGLANNHMCRSRMYEDEAWGRPRDTERLPAPLGNGRWSQEIYYHLLNCGLRLPPSAGSASGVLPNPLGYDRVYVHVDRPLTYEKWWAGLKAGRSFVTNGPLLVVTANGHPPGHVFSGSAGQVITVDVDATLTSLDNVPAVEIIKNGLVERSVAPASGVQRVPLGSVEFERSGWFLVRAISDVGHTFRFASTAPCYVEIGVAKQRVSRASVQFFVDWVAERIERVPQKLHDPGQLEEVLAHHRKAREFWADLLRKANAE